MSNPYDMGEKRQISILGPTLKFKGELTANEDLVIQGAIEGSIRHTSNLTIGEEGKLKADVKAEHISIEGQVEGDLEGRTSVVVKTSANVSGNIYSPTVTLHEGSTFNGKIDMSGKAKSASGSPKKSQQVEEKPAVADQAVADESDEVAKTEAPKKRSAGSA